MNGEDAAEAVNLLPERWITCGVCWTEPVLLISVSDGLFTPAKSSLLNFICPLESAA